MSLAQLTYTSHANQLITWDLIRDILSVAQPNNKKLGITGILISHGMNFLQRLEGEQAVIENLFSDICRDSRHSEIHLLGVEPIRQRQFARWSMQGFEFDQLEPARQEMILNRYFSDKGKFYIPTDAATCLALVDDLQLS